MTTCAPVRSPIAAPKNEKPSPVRRVSAESGASAAVARRDGREVIEVRDSRARLVFELDTETGRAVLLVPEGDLTISAPGDIDLRAGGAVRCRAQELDLKSPRANLHFGETIFRGSTLRAALDEAALVVTRFERLSERVFERARSVFRTVEDLDQVRAGRMRTIVDDRYALRCGHASIEAREEVDVDGERIKLG